MSSVERKPGYTRGARALYKAGPARYIRRSLLSLEWISVESSERANERRRRHHDTTRETRVSRSRALRGRRSIELPTDRRWLGWLTS